MFRCIGTEEPQGLATGLNCWRENVGEAWEFESQYRDANTAAAA